MWDEIFPFTGKIYFWIQNRLRGSRVRLCAGFRRGCTFTGTNERTHTHTHAHAYAHITYVNNDADHSGVFQIQKVFEAFPETHLTKIENAQ